MPKERVLIAGNDRDRARTLAGSLMGDGYACEIVRTGAAAITAVTRGACDVVISDVRVGSGTDLELLVRLHLVDSALPVIIWTARGSIQGAIEAIKHGACQYLEHTGSYADLLRHLRAALCAGHGSKHASFDTRPVQLAQVSPQMRELARVIPLIARSSAAVLIVGESGTGKELVAHALHEHGPRAARPFVAINTTAIPEHLLESELFGHVRGAFTGAGQARPGLFAEAEGGTILLDEIGDMPKTLQPKLLRVLQFGELRAVGSDHSRRIDVRVIASTHRDLTRAVAEGHFREDLLYRLNTLLLRVPPLRERPEDIAVLAAQLLAAALTRNPESPVRSFSADLMRDLQARPWPGNVRELESAIERLVVLGLEPVMTGPPLAQEQAPPPAQRSDAWQPVEDAPSLRQMSERYVAWTLEQTGGDKALAAARLGIDVSTLYRKQRRKN